MASDECDVIREDVDEDEDEEEPRGGFSISIRCDSEHATCADCGHEYKSREARATWRVDLPPCEGTGDWEIEWEDSVCMKCFMRGTGRSLYKRLFKEYDKNGKKRKRCTNGKTC